MEESWTPCLSKAGFTSCRNDCKEYCAIFLPLTFIVFFKGLVPKEAGFAAMIAGIMVACLWPFIFPDSANALFPSLAFNLLFLVPGVLWSLYKNKDRRV